MSQGGGCRSRMNNLDGKMSEGLKVYNQNRKAMTSSMEIKVTDSHPR